MYIDVSLRFESDVVVVVVLLSKAQMIVVLAKRALFLVLFAAAFPVGFSSTTASPLSPSSVDDLIDLSHIHHLPMSSQKAAIEKYAIVNGNNENVVLRLSHNSITDESIKELLSPPKLLQAGGLRLDLSTNRLTPVGVHWLFQTILDAQQPTKGETGGQATRITPASSLAAIDLAWNYLASDVAETSNFYKTLEKLVAHPYACPRDLCFDQCSLGPGFCRAMGKGLMLRYLDEDGGEESTETDKTERRTMRPFSLSLCGNADIGDAGAAALAAALRTIATSDSGSVKAEKTLLEKLDLSSCGIGNFGCEALALAIEDGCGVGTLDLSNNQIKDEGVAALGRAIALAGRPTVRVLDLSNNEVGVNGCTALLVAMGKGHLRQVRLRSCHIHADGAEIIGKGLRGLVIQKSIPELDIDLSGNPFGVLRGKARKDGGKYSASRLKSTATATAASYMNLLKKGLKDVGMDNMLGKSSESDDEEEEKLGGPESSEEDDESSSEFAKKRCGAKSMVNAFLRDHDEEKEPSSSVERCIIRLGLRHCFFDHGAADALAAMLVEAKDRHATAIAMDVDMNPVLEDEMVSALHGDDDADDRLHEMAERHLDILEAIKEAEERAAEERAMARERSQSTWDQSPFDEDEGDHDLIPDYDDDDYDERDYD